MDDDSLYSNRSEGCKLIGEAIARALKKPLQETPILWINQSLDFDDAFSSTDSEEICLLEEESPKQHSSNATSKPITRSKLSSTRTSKRIMKSPSQDSEYIATSSVDMDLPT